MTILAACTCGRETAPIRGTTESAFRYVVGFDCPLHKAGHWPEGWRWLRDGRPLGPGWEINA